MLSSNLSNTLYAVLPFSCVRWRACRHDLPDGCRRAYGRLRARRSICSSLKMCRLAAVMVLCFFGSIVRAMHRATPRLDPVGPFVVADSGQNISFTCSADDPVFWMIDNQHSVPLYEDTVDENVGYSVSLHMTNLSYTDVGYFYCAYNTTDNLEEVDVDHSLVASIYLFVRDDENFLSGATLTMVLSETRAVKDERITVPCKGAFPDVEVSVTFNHVNLVEQSYDPFKGVTFRVGEEGFYQCDGYYKAQTLIQPFYVRLQKDLDAPPEPPSIKLSSFWQKRAMKIWTRSAAADPRSSYSGLDGSLSIGTLTEVEEFDIVGGSDVTLTCSSEYPSNLVTLQWKRPLEENKFQVLDAFSIVANEDGSTHVDIRLRKLNKTRDEGTYVCEAQLTAPGHSASQSQISVRRVHLNVLSSPYLDMEAENPVIKEDFEHDLSVRWRLLYRAYPDPGFTLLRNGKRLLESPRGRDQSQGRYHLHVYRKLSELSLELEAANIDDVGVYTLVSEVRGPEEEGTGSPQLRQEVNLTLLLQSAPSKTRLDVGHLQLRSMTVPGRTHPVQCRTDAFPPPQFVLEFSKCFADHPCQEFEDIQVTATVPGTVGLHGTVSGHHSASWSLRVTDQGLLRCRVKNEHGSEVSDPVQVMVADGPSVSPIAVERADGGALVAEGENVELRCFANEMATSGRRVAWARLVDPNSLTSTTPDSQTTQVVVASPTNGPEGKEEGNETTSTPFSSRQNWTDSSEGLADGSEVLLAVTPASRRDKAHWQVMHGNKEDVSVFTWHTNYSNVHVIVLSNVTTRDSGLYACRDLDSNHQGQDSLYRLQVERVQDPRWATPDGSSPLPPHLNVNATVPLTLHCPAYGVPKPDVTWFKNGKPFLEPREGVTVRGGTLNFSFIRSSDDAIYSCLASNRQASIRAQTRIQVLDPDKWYETLMKIFVVVLVCILIPFTVGCLAYKLIHKQHRRLKERMEDQRSFEFGNPSRLNPELCVGDQADLLPYDSAFEVSRRNVQLVRLLGTGEFGRVYQARVDRLLPGQRRTTVAVKTIRCRSDKTQIKALRSELKIMVHIGRHINIVNLLGACSRDVASKGELLLIVEFCRLGCLLDYLRKRRRDFVPEHLDFMGEEKEEEGDGEKYNEETELEDEEEEDEESDSEGDVRTAEDSGEDEDEDETYLSMGGSSVGGSKTRREDGGRSTERRHDVMQYLKQRKKRHVSSTVPSDTFASSCIKYAKLQFEEDLAPDTPDAVPPGSWLQPTQEESHGTTNNESYPREREDIPNPASNGGVAKNETERNYNTPKITSASSVHCIASYSSTGVVAPDPKPICTTDLSSPNPNTLDSKSPISASLKDATVPSPTTTRLSSPVDSHVHKLTGAALTDCSDVTLGNGVGKMFCERTGSRTSLVDSAFRVNDKDADDHRRYSDESPPSVSGLQSAFGNSVDTNSTVDINVEFEYNQVTNKPMSQDKMTGFRGLSQTTNNQKKKKRKRTGRRDKEATSGKGESGATAVEERTDKKKKQSGDGMENENYDRGELNEGVKRNTKKDEEEGKDRKKRAKRWLGKEKGSKGDERELQADTLSSKDLLCWAFQIARGMEYLAHRKVLHGDLAARNILLAENNIVKISDFGLSRDLYREHYRKKSRDPLPIKWLSIEALRDRIFSTQSDVWSFGVVLWELFTLGATPYPGVEVDELFLTRLLQGMRLTCPTRASPKLYRLMQDCWREDPMLRPSFSYLQDVLGRTLEREARQYYLTLDEHCTGDGVVQQQGESFSGGSDGNNGCVDYLANIRSPDFNLITALPSVVTPNHHLNDADVSESPRSELSENMGYVIPRDPPLDGDISENCLQKPSVDDREGDGTSGVRLSPNCTELLSFIQNGDLAGDSGCPREVVSTFNPLHNGAKPLHKVVYNSFDSPGICSQHNPYYDFIDPSLMTDENNYMSREEVDKCVGRGRESKNDNEDKLKSNWKENTVETEGDNRSIDRIESRQVNDSQTSLSNCHESNGNSKAVIGNCQQWLGNAVHYSGNYQLHQGNSTCTNLTQLSQTTVHYVNLHS